jgi:hypothetical protein
MSAHLKQEFSGYTPERFDRLRAAIEAEAGLKLDGDKGMAEKSGVVVSWVYDRAKQDLTLQTLKNPFFISEGVIDKKLHDVAENTK